MKEVFNYYKDFLYFQNIFLYSIVIFWIFRKKISERFFFGYFFFNFLAVSGSISHIKYVMDISLKISIFSKALLFLLFSSGALSVYFYALRRKTGFLILYSISLILLFLFFKTTSQGYISLYIWEIIAFYLFILFAVLFSEYKNDFELNPALSSIIFFLLFFLGAVHNEFVKLPKSIILSPIGILPSATMLIVISFLGLNKKESREANLIILFSSVFIILSSPSTLKFYKISVFAGALFLNTRRFLERRT